MNKVFISGMITEMPMLRMENGSIPHLIVLLSVRHRNGSGTIQDEVYRVNAWHNTAGWGADNLKKGQMIGVQGYLTQHRVHAGDAEFTCTEIVADEFLGGLIIEGKKANAIDYRHEEN